MRPLSTTGMKTTRALHDRLGGAVHIYLLHGVPRGAGLDGWVWGGCSFRREAGAPWTDAWSLEMLQPALAAALDARSSIVLRWDTVRWFKRS